MLIRCYGARGSIPVSGSQYVRYGGDTTCLEIRTRNDQIIMVDAGTGIRRLGHRLVGEGRFDFHLFFTHSHLDHILGFPFFRLLYYENATIRLQGCPTAQGDIKKLLSKAIHPPLFPVPFENFKADVRYSAECPTSFLIDSMEIQHINLSHPNVGMGYRFVEDGKVFVFLTDNELGFRHRGGCSPEEYSTFAAGADLLIHDAEYTPEEYALTRTWGHSTYVEALNLAMAARVKRFGLFHHNRERGDEALDAIVEKCRKTLHEKGLDTTCFTLTQDWEIVL